MKTEIIKTLLAVGAVFCFLYTLKGIFLWTVERLHRKSLKSAVIVFSVKDDAENAEEKLLAAQSITLRSGAEFCRIVFLDTGLSEEGRKLCKILCRDEQALLIDDVRELYGIIKD